MVVPTHHRPVLLRKLLESLAGQTMPRHAFDVILVASENDAAFALAEEFKARMDVRCVSVPNDPMNGRSAAAKRNYGAEVSSGAWIAFIDDDCIADLRWLEGAARLFDRADAGAIEGRKSIPTPPRPTVTYKGLVTFERPGGYQTCNVFYRRTDFEKVGGFDLNFPFYLEDSDLAWSVLDAGRVIPFAHEAVVYHPVLVSQPWRMLDDAKRAVLMPYLYKKHPQRYRESKTRVLRGAHWAYLVMYVVLVVLVAMQMWWWLLAAFAAVLLMWAAHAWKLFRGCDFTAHEFVVTTLLLPVVPVVKWVQLMRGNMKHGVWLWT